jgi:nucleotide-binding universal stress UspA family protein
MVRIQRILCPIDFSDFSRHAFNRALAIARSHDATVTAFHVVPMALASPMLPYVEPASLGPFEISSGERAHIVENLHRFLELPQTPDAKVALDTAAAHDVPQQILAQSNRLAADLVVMGTHGRSGVERLMLGSVTEKILRKAKPPVLTVPAAAPADVVTAARPFARILCALDFSDCAMSAFRYARALAEESGATLAVLHAIELTPPAYDPLIGPPIDLPGYRLACERAVRDRLHNVIPAAARTSLDVEEIVVSGKPHHEILRVANQWHADLVVLGIHGHNVIDRVLFGSTVEPVVRRAHCPVLTVRADAIAASAAA